MRDVDAEQISALRGHREFRAAIRHSASGLIALYQGNWILNRVMNDRGRAVMGFFALYLDALGRAEPSHPGLTVSGVKTLFARTRLSSPGRAVAMLALMRMAGYVAPVPTDGDRRVRRLRPTEKLLAAHRSRWAVQFDAMAPLDLGTGLARSRLDDARFCDGLILHLVGRRLEGVAPIDHAPGLELFMDRDAGIMVLFSLLLAGAEVPPLGPVDVSVSALSRRFGVSRVHVAKLLRDAAGCGFLDRRPDGAVHLSPDLVDASERFFAAVFLALSAAARAAMAPREDISCQAFTDPTQASLRHRQAS